MAVHKAQRRVEERSRCAAGRRERPHTPHEDAHTQLREAKHRADPTLRAHDLIALVERSSPPRKLRCQPLLVGALLERQRSPSVTYRAAPAREHGCRNSRRVARADGARRCPYGARVHDATLPQGDGCRQPEQRCLPMGTGCIATRTARRRPSRDHETHRRVATSVARLRRDAVQPSACPRRTQPGAPARENERLRFGRRQLGVTAQRVAHGAELAGGAAPLAPRASAGRAVAIRAPSGAV